MTLSKTVFAASIATVLASALPAAALVPGSHYFQDRSEERGRQAVASGVETAAASGTAISDTNTFVYAAADTGSLRRAPVNNRYDRDRTEEAVRQQIR